MNQDRIRDRILRRASRMWGYNESETENTSLRQRGLGKLANLGIRK